MTQRPFPTEPERDAEYAREKRRRLIGYLTHHMQGDCPVCDALPARAPMAFKRSAHFAFNCGAVVRLSLEREPRLEVVTACPTRMERMLEATTETLTERAVEVAMETVETWNLPDEAQADCRGDVADEEAEKQEERDRWLS